MDKPELPSIEDVLGPRGRLSRTLLTYDYRPQQTQAAEAIAEAIARRKTCLIEAGTGVGKTLAYLVPAAMAIAQGARVVVATYTINLQSQLMDKDIPILEALLPEVPFRVCLLKGKNRYLCKHEFDFAAGDIFHTTEPLFPALREWVATTETGDADELPFVYPRWSEIGVHPDTCRGERCHYFQECFYFAARRRAHQANLLVVNHALLLMDVITRNTTRDRTNLLPDYDVLIVDEAHHLEDAATSAFSTSLADWEIPSFVERLRRARPPTEIAHACDNVRTLNASLFQFADRYAYDFDVAEQLGPDGLESLTIRAIELQSALASLRNELQAQMGEASAPDSIERTRLEGWIQTCERLTQTVAGLFDSSEDSVLWCAVTDRPANAASTANGRRLTWKTLNRTPIEVGPMLRDRLWPLPSCAVLTSATLATSSGFSYIRERLGLDEHAEGHKVGSPFDFSSQALLYVPEHMPPPPKEFDDIHIGHIVAEICPLLKMTEGRAFLLFTSRRALNAVYETIRNRVPFPLFRQGDMPPARLLEQYRESGNGVLLGNQMFWEGVDVQGEALSLVVIDRIPFAVPDSPITKARLSAISAAGHDPFWAYSVPQAQIRLKQGFGRLIRTPTDRGIVCVLDSRLLHRTYGRLFLQALPPASVATTRSAVDRFWYA